MHILSVFLSTVLYILGAGMGLSFATILVALAFDPYSTTRTQLACFSALLFELAVFITWLRL